MNTPPSAIVSVVLAALAAALAAPRPAQAGGFLVYDVSGAATAQASAVVAAPSEPATVWYNPAGMSFLPGWRVSLGGELVTAHTTFEPAGGQPDVETEPNVYVLPHLFGTFEILPWLHAGVGVVTAFGLGNSWPDDWLGREFSISSELVTVNLNPAVSFRLHELVSLAAGFQLVRGTVDLTNGLPDPVGGRVRLGGAGWGYGGNLGVLVRPLPERLHVGFAWRSRVAVDLAGRADFDPHPAFAPGLPDQGGDTAVTLPDILALGLMWRPIDVVRLGLDVNLVLWDTYDETVVTLDDGQTLVQPHHYDASWVVRAGVEWTTPVEGLRVRGGLMWDQSPAPAAYLDPSTPDADQIDVCAGVGYRIAWFAADLGYQLVIYLPREATTGVVGPEGTYRTLAHVLALTVSAVFGDEPREL